MEEKTTKATATSRQLQYAIGSGKMLAGVDSTRTVYEALREAGHKRGEDWYGIYFDHTEQIVRISPALAGAVTGYSTREIERQIEHGEIPSFRQGRASEVIVDQAMRPGVEAFISGIVENYLDGG